MRIAKIRKEDISNGPGIRVSIYVQGCTHHCDGCFNPETWNFNGGHLLNNRIMMQVADLGADKHIAGYSFLGGEPMQQDDDLVRFLKYLKATDGKPIWMWTGYTWEELQDSQSQMEVLRYVDVLVDGKYDKTKPAINKRFRGSMNQRIIDVKASLRAHKVVLSEFN